MAISFFLLGCNKEIAIETEENLVKESEVFTLTATYGSPDTKVTFDDDGLNMTWQPGDCLYLFDVTGTNSTVRMETSITEPSKTAAFRSTSSVLSGEYIVLYGQYGLSVSKSIEMTTIASLNNQILLYGSLTVEDGQTSASINLSQVFAMLTFKFKNLPELSNMKLGVVATEGGLPTFNTGLITSSGLIRSSSNILRLNFGWNNGEDGKSLIAPVDLTGKTLYFFIYGTDADGKHITYEFVKNGRNLSAGVNYNLTFDFSQASSICSLSKSSINSGAYILNTPESFRAASYWNGSGISYSVEADVDFTGEVYFPIASKALYGNDHKLSNINVNLSNFSSVGVLSTGQVTDLTVENSSFIGDNNVGVTSSGWVNNLTVKNSSFKGNEYVGALAGSCGGSSISDCIADGVTVEGSSYVGGLIGYLAPTSSSNLELNKCSLVGNSTIISTGSYAGGLVGRSMNYLNYNYSYTISNCLVNGNISISGNQYVGGLVGFSYKGISNCLVKGTVLISGNTYVGGIAGQSNLEINQCGFEGEVTGNSGSSYVGGIIGSGTVKKSFVKGDIKASSYVGGVSGVGSCYNSYHIGNTVGEGSLVGGISGSGSMTDCYNCYSYGTTSSSYGISFSLNTNYDSKNLTSSSKISGNSSNTANCNCGPSKTFLSKLSVINSEEAYSTQVWEDIDAQCPLLQWQSDVLNGFIDIPGFNDVDW